jgi:hypothetical protein
MTHEEIVKERIKELYEDPRYKFSIPFERIKYSGDIVEVELNDGSVVLTDRLAEFILCKDSPEYFINHYCFTNNPIKGYVPFKLHEFQYEVLEAYRNHRRVIFLKSRQVGASALSGAYALWKANFNKGQMIKIISMTRADASEFLTKNILLSYERLPGFLKSSTKSSKQSRSKLELINNSSIYVLPNSPNSGRGGTPSLIILDEFAFYRNDSDLIAAIDPSLQQGGAIFLISTANGSDPNQYYYSTWHKAINGQSEYFPVYLPWAFFPGRSNDEWLNDLMKKRRTGEWSQQLVDQFIHQKEDEQLSYKGPIQDAPYLFKMRTSAKSETLFRQEILASFEGSSNTVLSFDTITELEKSIVAPIKKDELDSKPLLGFWMFKDRDDNGSYIITADVARGDGKDWSAFHVIQANVKPQEQVAEYKAQPATDDYAAILKKVGYYYNNAMIIVESNSIGIATFNELYKSRIDPYENLYVQMKGRFPLGWETTLKSRPLLVDAFYKNVTNKETIIRSARMLEEIKTFVWNENGKAEATFNSNDDLIMSYSFYCHLKDVLDIRAPISVHSSYITVNPGENIELDDWGAREEMISTMYGVDLETYYELQGIHIPQEYYEYLQEQATMYDGLESGRI